MHLPRRNACTTDGTEQPNSPAELLLMLPNNNFIVIPGYFGNAVLFEKRHFYQYYRNDVVDYKLNFQCIDFQFLLLVDPTGKQQTRRRKCPAKPGELHKHEVLSQEMLELAAVFWECLLRIFSRRSQETNLQLIESALSSWPHQLSFPLSVESKFRDSLNYYRKRAAKNEEFVQHFLAQHSKDKLAHFRQVVLQFRSAPVPPSQF